MGIFCTLKIIIINISRCALHFVLQSRIMRIYPVVGVQWQCKSHCHSVGFCLALGIVLALNSCVSAAKYEHLAFFQKLCWNYFWIFTQNEMKRKRTDGESAKAVREQVFLSRYKSVPGIVGDSKFSAYCQWLRTDQVLTFLKIVLLFFVF